MDVIEGSKRSVVRNLSSNIASRHLNLFLGKTIYESWYQDRLHELGIDLRKKSILVGEIFFPQGYDDIRTALEQANSDKITLNRLYGSARRISKPMGWVR